MDFQKIYWWPRPVRIRLQGSEPGTVCQSFLGIKNAASYKTMRQIGGPRGIRTLDLSDANRTLSQQYRFCAHLMHCEKKQNQRIFVHIKRPAIPTAFLGRKYGFQSADFQGEAIWGVIWLADKWATGPWDVTHMGFRCITSQFTIKYDVP